MLRTLFFPVKEKKILKKFLYSILFKINFLSYIQINSILKFWFLSCVVFSEMSESFLAAMIAIIGTELMAFIVIVLAEPIIVFMIFSWTLLGLLLVTVSLGFP